MSPIALLRFCAVMPARLRISAAVVPLASASASSMYSTVTNEIPGLLRQLLGLVEQAGGLRREIDLPGTGALDFGHLRQLEIDFPPDLRRRADGGLDQIRGQPLLVVEQGLEHMQWRQLLMTAAQSKGLRRLDQRLE